jgi:hypothetical protein
MSRRYFAALFKHSSQAENDGIRVAQRMFPHPHDPPTFLAQQPFNSSVSGDIPCELLFPILAVVLWGPGAKAAAVPEAAINKDNETLARECEVWPSGQV